jgi:polar amino acid transport system substrate-binding protein
MNAWNPRHHFGLYATCVRSLRYLVLPVCALLSTPVVLAVDLTTGPNYPPLSDQSKADGGIATRIVSATFQSMGEAVLLDWLPWKRGFEDTKAGRYQATFPYVRSPERELDFLYSDVIFTHQSFLWTRTGDTLSAQDPSTFKGQKALCIPHGYRSPIEDVLRTQIASGEVRVERPITRESCIRMLVSKRVDATTGSEGEVGASLLATGLGTQISRGKKPIVELDFFLIAPKSNPQSAELINRFNSQLRKLRADGQYRRLAEE